MLSVNLYPYSFLPFFLPLRPCSEHYIDFRYVILLFGQLCRLRGRKKYMSSTEWVSNSIPKGLCCRFIKFHCTCEFAVLNFNFETQKKRMTFFSPSGMYKFALNFWCKPHRFQKRATEWYRALVPVFNSL